MLNFHCASSRIKDQALPNILSIERPLSAMLALLLEQILQLINAYRLQTLNKTCKGILSCRSRCRETKQKDVIFYVIEFESFN